MSTPPTAIIKTCPCCGQTYGAIPPGSWISYIGGWHTVRISTSNDPHEALAYDNNPAIAAKYSWNKWAAIGGIAAAEEAFRQATIIEEWVKTKQKDICN